jgi:putative colanic acid biosynthesis UDP-glucose lipid carrier transferase
MTPNQTPSIETLADFVIASALLILTMPLTAIIALSIKLDSPGPVFYREERIGSSGCRYNALKFRTTVHESERDGLIRSVQRDAHFTRVGWLLWHIRLDRLPRLINVLRGEMSCIGATPQRPHFLS